MGNWNKVGVHQFLLVALNRIVELMDQSDIHSMHDSVAVSINMKQRNECHALFFRLTISIPILNKNICLPNLNLSEIKNSFLQNVLFNRIKCRTREQ